MIAKVVFLGLVAFVAAQDQKGDAGPPQPYSFNFDSTDEFGTRMAQEESGDEANRKTGFYSFTDASGVSRRVDYVADETGFHATVTTNEAGTKTSNPADASFTSSADPAQQQQGSSAASAKPAGSAQPVSAGGHAIHAVALQSLPHALHGGSPITLSAVQSPVGHYAFGGSPLTLNAVHSQGGYHSGTPLTLHISQASPFSSGGHVPLAYSTNASPISYNANPFNFVLGRSAGKK